MSRERRAVFASVGLVAAVAVWVYWPATEGRFLTGMDDDEYLRQAARLNGLTWAGLKWAFTSTQPYYHPLPRLSHVLDYQLWRADAAGHHATSVTVHVVNAALVLGFVWTLLASVGTISTSERFWMTVGVGAVFAFHPLQVESVAWISGRTTLLCTMFGIGCLWAYVAGIRRWVVWLLFAAALLCKPMAVSLPFVMLAMDYYPLRRHERFGWPTLIREKLLPVALCVVVTVATMITESRPGGLMHRLGAIVPTQRLLLAAQSLTFYPWKLVWPVTLSPYYPLRLGLSFREPAIVVSVLIVCMITALSVYRRRECPGLLSGWAAYAAFVLPVSGLVQTGGQSVADRYAYCAMVPLLLMLGGAAVWMWRRSAVITRTALAALLVCELAFFAFRARGEIFVWRNDEALWRAVVAQFPQSAFANAGLANVLLSEKLFDEAQQYSERVVRLAPWASEGHVLLAWGFFKRRLYDQARQEAEAALRLDSTQAGMHYVLACLDSKRGGYETALEHLRICLRDRPQYGAVAQRDEALDDLRQSPEYAAAFQALLEVTK